MKNSISFLFLLLLLATACVEPFNPELGDAVDIIVIEGLVLEGKVPAEVRISRTFDVGSQDQPMVSGAQVVIRDENGTEFLLTETDPGIYLSDTSQLTGTPNLSYQLAVATADGQQYESDWEVLRPSAPIERIYTEPAERQDSIPGKSVQGLAVYLDTRDPENDSRYYRWEWQETWEFTVPHAVYHTWDLQTHRVQPIPEEEWGYLCWKTNRSASIHTATTAQLTEDVVERYPLQFISFKDNRLSRKYSLQVKQYILTPEAYSYWKNLEALNENLGTLFDPIPTEIIGNLHNTEDPDQPVIGYFSACGFTQDRIWIRVQDLPFGATVSSGYEDCVIDSITDQLEFANLIQYSNYAYVDTILSPFGNFAGWQVAPRYCTDCRLEGTNQKPDFWQ